MGKLHTGRCYCIAYQSHLKQEKSKLSGNILNLGSNEPIFSEIQQNLVK